jgi:copper resistance protein C
MVQVAVLLGLLGAGRIAEGHAILKETSPAASAKVTGPDVDIRLKYNVRIDAARSKVQLMTPDNTMVDLKLDPPSSPDTLTCKATGLKPGAYKIAWQVLANDGHITRGLVPFTVTGP